MLFIAATMSVLAAQRFGEEFGVWDRVGTCPIPTLASSSLDQRLPFGFHCESDSEARGESRPSPLWGSLHGKYTQPSKPSRGVLILSLGPPASHCVFMDYAYGPFPISAGGRIVCRTNCVAVFPVVGINGKRNRCQEYAIYAPLHSCHLGGDRGPPCHSFTSTSRPSHLRTHSIEPRSKR